MAKAVEFDEYEPPDYLAPKEAIPVFFDAENNQTISCWELTGDELVEVLQTKRVWLVTQGGEHPPSEIEGQHPWYFGGIDAKPKGASDG